MHLTAFQAKDLFSKQSASYAAFRPSYPDELFEDLYKLCPKHEIAWDVACGTGQATAALAKKFETVTGTDLSAEQLKHATQASNIKYHVLSAEEDPNTIGEVIPMGQIDLITVAQAIHWFDIGKFLRNAALALKSEGVLAVWTYTWPVFPDDDDLSKFLLKIALEVLGEYWAPERQIVNDRYVGIDFAGFNPVLSRLEEPWGHIEKVWRKQDMLGYFYSWSAYQTAVSHLKPEGELLAECLPELDQLWGDVEHRTVHFPVYLWAGRPQQ